MFRTGPILGCILINVVGILTTAQDICSCTPLVYEWRLDFNRTCVPTNVTVGPNKGIREVFCSIEAFDPNQSDNLIANVAPIKVVSYQIIELSLELTPMKSDSSANVTLVNGDTITFSSLTAVDPSEYSGGFQVSLLGINSDSESIVLEWLVRYSNLCETIPYSLGDSIGWMVYDSKTPSRPETCLLRSDVPSTRPSHFPSVNPSIFPTAHPSDKPSFSTSPTAHPSDKPSFSTSPTAHPSDGPSLRRSRIPSTYPSGAPSNESIKPTTKPSFIPSYRATILPSVKPSSDPHLDPSTTPSFHPTEFSMSYSYSFDYQNSDLQLARWLDEYETTTEFGRKVNLDKDEKN